MAKYLDYEGLERYTGYVKGKLDGKAAFSHNHSASNITSGTLAVARGGTGVTSNPSMLANLGSTSAASVFAASPRPGVTGTLPIANGGTGATTAAAARTALGITLANLGAAASSHSHSAATSSAAGFMSAADKAKLDGISITVLYSNSSGTTGTITLSQTAANYAFLEIQYTDGSRTLTRRVHSPNGKTVSIDRSVYGNDTFYIGAMIVSISGTSITRVTANCGIASFTSSGALAVSPETGHLPITTVIGYT